MHFHARIAQFLRPSAAQKTAAADRIGQNGAVHPASGRTQYRIQQLFNTPLRLDNVKRQQTGMFGRFDVCQHGVDDIVGGCQQRHPVALRRAQTRAARRHPADAVIMRFHFVADVEIHFFQIFLGKPAVKTVHFAHALRARRTQPRFADQQVAYRAEHGEQEQDNQPCKRRTDVALFVEYPHHAGERGAGMGKQENFRPSDVFQKGHNVRSQR